MKREPSKGSTNIKSVGYEDGIMEVEFNGGGCYRYTCPRAVFETWQKEGFRGGHFHKHIRSAFQGKKQPPQRGPING